MGDSHATRRASWRTVWVVAVTAGCSPAGHPSAAQEPNAVPRSATPELPAVQPTAADHPPSMPPLAKTYTEKERGQLTYCIGLCETARRAAAEKLRGTPIEDVKKLYDGKANARLNIATVDKVFSDHVSTAWDYTVSFFSECAREIAGVPSDRAQLASYCMQNQLIADVAFQYKASGKPKEQAYAYFAQFKSSTPKAIVDLVYASTKERAAVRMEVWNTCMAELSGA
jgi:hypothetical protein